MNLISRLIEAGVLDKKSQAELEYDIKRTGKTEEEVILEKGLVAEDVLFKFKAEVFKVQFRQINPEEVPLEILELIPEEPTATYKMIPLSRKEDLVQIGMVYPESIPAQDALRFLSRQGNFKYEVQLITITDFNKLLKQHRTLKGEAERALVELEKIRRGADQPSIDAKIEEMNIVGGEAPIIKMVMVIVRHALETNASDIHIEPGKDKLKIRFRVDGILYPSLFLPISVHASIVTRIKILTNLKIDENRVPQDGRFTMKVGDKEIDFRVATYPTLNGEKVAIRVLDSSEGLKSYKDLGLVGRNFDVIKEAIKKPYGMILATGPTGSGKTTTLYALLRLLNNEGVNIVTLEDPIEYSIAGVNQSQIKPEIGYTFAEGLRQILRQDPNVIMVGEIRDEETATLATHASLTGHIVLSTLHTNSAIGVIPRLLDMGVRQFLLPYTLSVVISQRLVRTLCPNCKKKISPSEKVKSYILEKIKNIPIESRRDIKLPSKDQIFIYEPKGCEKCKQKGYVGRVGLYEVLSMTEELTDVIFKSPTESAVSKAAKKQGMLTMEQEGIVKILAGETTVEEVSRVTEAR